MARLARLVVPELSSQNSNKKRSELGNVPLELRTTIMIAIDSDAYDLLLTLRACHYLMKAHADELASQSAVTDVQYWFDMPNVHGAFRFVEYVDVEMSDGEALSWCIEVTVSLDGIDVEADVRRVHSHGQDILAEIADRRYESIADCSRELIEITQRLCASNTDTGISR